MPEVRERETIVARGGGGAAVAAVVALVAILAILFVVFQDRIVGGDSGPATEVTLDGPDVSVEAPEGPAVNVESPEGPEIILEAPRAPADEADDDAGQ